MFSSGPNYTKLKTNLRLAINRLKLLEKKKTELAQKARKEIADYLSSGKVERAKIRVEHIIREDYLVEAMEVTEMYCDLLLARFGLIQQMKDLDEGLAEAISSIIWAAPRLQTDVAELKLIADQLGLKYGKPYAQACREQQVATISEKLVHKLGVQAPPKVLVEKYLVEIAHNYNLEYEPDPQVMRESEWGSDALISLDDNTNDLGGDGGATGGGDGGSKMNIAPAGFVGYPPQPHPAVQPFAYPPPPSPLLLLNPQSLTNCFDEFSTLVKEYCPEVVAISETWFSPTRPALDYVLPGYCLYHEDREGRGGGVALYVSRDLVSSQRSVKVPLDVECLWVDIFQKDCRKLIAVICALYHPPRSTAGNLLMTHIVNNILDIASCDEKVTIIVMGDFNHLPQNRICSALNIDNLVLEPTHMNSALDLILTSRPELYAAPVLLPPIGHSRHSPVLLHSKNE